MIKIEHLQSSTQIVHIGEIKVLTDPWLTPGEYYGSWFHFPPFFDAETTALEYDFIYVSHIHPDHLSEETFRRLPQKRPVLVHNYDSKFVKRKIESLGFEVIECNHGKPFFLPNGGSVTIYAADNCNPELCAKFLGCSPAEKRYGSTQIDTFAVFEMNDHAILNTNDCPFDLAETTIRLNRLHEKKIDLLLVGYGGAGPYPQCFRFDSDEAKREAAKAKEIQFLQQAVKYVNLLRPKSFAPFAGTYVLGSRLSKLTEYRGVPSISEALNYIIEKVDCEATGILLQKGDVYDVGIGSLQKNPFVPKQNYDEFIEDISRLPLSYDNDEWDDGELANLVSAAYGRFKAKAREIGFFSETQIVVGSIDNMFIFSTQQEPRPISSSTHVEGPVVRMQVDNNLFHRLLRGPRFAHWNNAEIGSHIEYERRPNIFERGLYYCMCFFHQ